MTTGHAQETTQALFPTVPTVPSAAAKVGEHAANGDSAVECMSGLLRIFLDDDREIERSLWKFARIGGERRYSYSPQLRPTWPFVPCSTKADTLVAAVRSG